MKAIESLLFFLFVAFAAQLSAQATLSVQGTIQKSFGAAVDDGEYSLTFKLYTTDAGGSPVWTETQDGISVIGGVYSVLLGEVEPLTAAFDQTYYLGISVDGGAELSPRARLTSSPYALSLIGQGNKFPSTGTVGVGTASPAAGTQLHVKNGAGDGKILVEGTNNAEIEFKQGSNTASITYNGTHISIENLALVDDINLLANKTIKYNGLSDWRLVDTDDFSVNAEGWDCYSSNESTTTLGCSRELLGAPINNGYALIASIANYANKYFKKEINLTGIPHTQVKVVATVHFLDKFLSTSTMTSWAGFSTALGSNPASNGQVMNCWSYSEDVNSLTTYYASNAGDGSQRAEIVIANSSNTIYAYFAGYAGASAYGALGIANVEIWVK